MDFEGYTVAQNVKIGSSNIVPKATWSALGPKVT